MIDYLRMTITRTGELYEYSVAFDSGGFMMQLYGKSLSVVDSVQQALLFVLKRRVYPSRKITALNMYYLMLLVEGLSHEQIGERLGVEQSNVAYHLGQIRKHLGANSNVQAVFLATVLGCLQPFEPSGWHPDWLE